MKWEDFKRLTHEGQQAFIDEFGNKAPVNGAALARHFGVAVSTVTRFINANNLTANAAPPKPINITPDAHRIASHIVASNTMANGVLTPSSELKQLFVRSQNSSYSVHLTKRCLQLLSREEQKLGKDLCQFNASDLDEVFMEWFGTGTSHHRHAMAIIKDYVRFCAAIGIDTSNEAQDYTPDISQKVRRLMVASPLHLSIRLDKAFGKITCLSMDCIYCCIAWMAYAGIPKQLLPDITKRDVDLDSLHITAGDARYPLYKESTRVFKYAIEGTQFTLHNSRGTFTRDRVRGTRILRGYTNDSVNIASMLRNMTDKAAKRDVSFTYSLAKRSGDFYRVYELERIGFEPDFANIIAERMQRGATRVDPGWIRQDYELWKRAFG